MSASNPINRQLISSETFAVPGFEDFTSWGASRCIEHISVDNQETGSIFSLSPEINRPFPVVLGLQAKATLRRNRAAIETDCDRTEHVSTP